MARTCTENSIECNDTMAVHEGLRPVLVYVPCTSKLASPQAIPRFCITLAARNLGKGQRHLAARIPCKPYGVSSSTCACCGTSDSNQFGGIHGRTRFAEYVEPFQPWRALWSRRPAGVLQSTAEFTFIQMIASAQGHDPDREGWVDQDVMDQVSGYREAIEYKNLNISEDVYAA